MEIDVTLLIAKLILLLTLLASGVNHTGSSPTSPPIAVPLDSPVANPQPSAGP